MRVVLIVVGWIAFAVTALALFERFAPRRYVRAFQKHVGNPAFRLSAGVMPGWAVIETRGRRTGRPHRVPVGGALVGRTFWLVAADGRQTSYVRNIEADPRVRVRIRSRWRTGSAYVVADDNPRWRALWSNPINAYIILLAGIDPLTIRIDLEGHS